VALGRTLVSVVGMLSVHMPEPFNCR
jgi:hypothetical protein